MSNYNKIILDPLPPPAIVQLVGTSSEQLVFNWTSVDSDCSTFQYNITSNCGNCVNTTAVNTTSVTCAISLSSADNNVMQCSFSIQSVVCANISGVPSTPLDVTLKGSYYALYALPHYNNLLANTYYAPSCSSRVAKNF